MLGRSKGEQIPLATERGRTYNHVKKVKQAQKGLVDHIKDIKNRLSFSKLPTAEKISLEKELSEASKLLDHSEGFVPRVAQ